MVMKSIFSTILMVSVETYSGNFRKGHNIKSEQQAMPLLTFTWNRYPTTVIIVIYSILYIIIYSYIHPEINLSF